MLRKHYNVHGRLNVGFDHGGCAANRLRYFYQPGETQKAEKERSRFPLRELSNASLSVLPQIQLDSRHSLSRSPGCKVSKENRRRVSSPSSPFPLNLLRRAPANYSLEYMPDQWAGKSQRH
jgi:hypothetical protein